MLRMRAQAITRVFWINSNLLYDFNDFNSNLKMVNFWESFQSKKHEGKMGTSTGHRRGRKSRIAPLGSFVGIATF